MLLRNLCKEVALECLEEADVEEYLSMQLEAKTIPSGLSRTIHRNSGGNPLFMATIVQDMVNKGLIAESEGVLTLTAPVDKIYPGIPETLEQMLAIQLERLSPEVRRMLQSGSVAGERFSVWSVNAMLDESPVSIEGACHKLAGGHQFIRAIGIHDAADGSPSPHYEFRHDLYRQTLYRSLSGMDRVKLHLALAERLMPICTAGKRELASEIARHFEAGRDYIQATRCLVLTAENTRQRFSFRDLPRTFFGALWKLIGAAAIGRAAEVEIQILQRIGEAQFALGEMSDLASHLPRKPRCN